MEKFLRNLIILLMNMVAMITWPVSSIMTGTIENKSGYMDTNEFIFMDASNIATAQKKLFMVFAGRC
jgi:hypothetical protein